MGSRLYAKEKPMFAMKLVATGAASFSGALLVGVVAMTGREVKRTGEDFSKLERTVDSLRAALAQTMPMRGFVKGRPNVSTDFNEDIESPLLDPSAFIDPLASVVGHVRVGRSVYLAPFASVRGDEGQPIFIGDGANVQDGAVVHALETVQEGKEVPGRTYNVGGREYAVYIGKRVSLAHQALVHGPARVDDNVFVGMQAMVFKAWVGEGAVIEPGAKVIGVTIPAHRYVSAGQTITDQKVADKLPEITDSYPFRALNDAVVHVNTSFASGYNLLAKDAEAATAAPGHGSQKESGKEAAASEKKEKEKGEKSHGSEKKKKSEH
jgi:carbonic anhydrase/acetyltransferase-like protein (isoleucine patch superfamily)